MEAEAVASRKNTEKMRIIFAGTPEFAVPSLVALCDSPHEVIALLSMPDRPRGRSRKPVWPETKKVAMERGVPVFQPLDPKPVSYTHLTLPTILRV